MSDTELPPELVALRDELAPRRESGTEDHLANLVAEHEAFRQRVVAWWEEVAAAEQPRRDERRRRALSVVRAAFSEPD